MSDASTTGTLLNGLSPERSKDVQQRIRADGDGDVARPLYRAQVEWTSGYHTVSHIAGGQTLEGDEPVA